MLTCVSLEINEYGDVTSCGVSYQVSHVGHIRARRRPGVPTRIDGSKEQMNEDALMQSIAHKGVIKVPPTIVLATAVA